MLHATNAYSPLLPWISPFALMMDGAMSEHMEDGNSGRTSRRLCTGEQRCQHFSLRKGRHPSVGGPIVRIGWRPFRQVIRDRHVHGGFNPTTSNIFIT